MFYPDENVRLLREIPGVAAAGGEGTVVKVVPGDSGAPDTLHVRFRRDDGEVDAIVSADGLELVISRVSQDRTAVLWGLESSPERLIEATLHSVMDRGYTMRAGLNTVRLHYDPQERWWKWGERQADPSGAKVAATAHAWDGCMVALSGPERFHLEFRLRGRREAAILLHEHEAVYMEQIRHSEPAMGLARVLTGLYEDLAAGFCAFPVADPWLMDEAWQSLLRAPLYPDFFLLPDAALPPELPQTFRAARLTHERVMLTALPVKFAPHDPPIHRQERDLKLDRLRKCHALGEKYYDQMYESRLGPTGLYSNAKDAFIDAIAAANDLGLSEEARVLEERLAHIKGVFRSQFT